MRHYNKPNKNKLLNIIVGINLAYSQKEQRRQTKKGGKIFQHVTLFWVLCNNRRV